VLSVLRRMLSINDMRHLSRPLYRPTGREAS
jgi:hypothetical protein